MADNAEVDAEAPTRSEALPVSASVLQHALNAVLTYHYGQSNQTPPTENKRLIEEINKHLAEIFFNKLFVLRPDIRNALRRLTIEPLCVLHGGRGTGKTTSILYIHSLLTGEYERYEEELQSTQDHRTDDDIEASDRVNARSLLGQIRHDPNWCFFVDVEASRNELSDTRTLCHLLFDRLYDRGVKLLDGFRDHWERFLEVEYAHLAQALIALDSILAKLKARGLDDSNLIQVATQSVSEARVRFDSERGTYRLELLLKFLDQEYSVAAGFAVDNIDLFDETLQKNVAIAMLNLCYTKKLLHHSIVGVRSENLPLIFDVLKGYTGLSPEDAIDVSISPEAFSVLEQLLSRRLNVIPEILDLTEVKQTYSSQIESGYLPSGDPSATMKSLNDALDVVRGLLAPSYDRPRSAQNDGVGDENYFKQILQWNNNSLRAALSASYHVGLLLASDSDPTYRFSRMRGGRLWARDMGRQFDGKQFGALVRDRVRFCRSFFIRQFVAESVKNMAFSHNLLLYEKPLDPVPTSQLPYLRLHILQALAHRGEKATIQELCQLLEPFGATHQRTRDALNGLRQPANAPRPDDRGLIHIDSKQSARDAAANTTVALLPAGRFMVDDLCFMSDYIFWNAYNTWNAEEFLGSARSGVTPEKLANEQFRISVSLKYLEKRIWDRYRRVFRLNTIHRGGREFRGADTAELLTRYLENFGTTPVPDGIAHEILDFTLAGRELNQEFRRQVITRTRKLQEDARQPFIDAGLRPLLTTRQGP